MSPDEIQDLAAGYAVGALDGEDRARFESLLRARDPEALAALRSFEGALARGVAETRQAPPPGVKAALMERIAADQAAAREPDRGAAPPTREAALRVRPARRRLRWGFVWGGALAAGLLAFLVATAVSQRYEDRLHDLAREAATLRDDLARQQALLAVLTDPATRIVALAGQPPSPGARARVLWHEQAGGILVAAGLPAPPPGKAYQLWALVPRRPPVPAGVFGVDARGVASLRLAPLPERVSVEGFAVTLEPAGGLPAPSGPIYLAGRA